MLIVVKGWLNDLWKYSNGTWAWITGDSSSGNGSAVYGTQGTPSILTCPGGRGNAVNWIDSSGSLWLLGGEGYDISGIDGK